MQANTFPAFVAERYPNGFTAGRHRSEDGEASVLEAYNQWRGRERTNAPTVAGLPDIRPLNYIDVFPALRTEWMLRLIEAYDGWSEWTDARKLAVADRIAVLTVNRIIAALPGLPPALAQKCRDARTLDAARHATYAALSSYAAAIVAAPCSAIAPAAEVAYFATAAAYAARADANAREQIFITACKLWMEAAEGASDV